MVGNFRYLGDTIEATVIAFDSDKTKIRNEWCKFRDLVLLLVSRGLPFVAKGRLYSARVHSVLIYRSET